MRSVLRFIPKYHGISLPSGDGEYENILPDIMIAAEKKSQNAPHLRLGGSQAEVFGHTATWVVCSYMYVSDRHPENGVLPGGKKMIILLRPQDSERRVQW